MRHQLRTVASAARSGPAKYASMVANVVDIPKPQEAFTEEIDNSRDTPFVPRLREKPNAVQPLDLAPVSGRGEKGAGWYGGSSWTHCCIIVRCERRRGRGGARAGEGRGAAVCGRKQCGAIFGEGWMKGCDGLMRRQVSHHTVRYTNCVHRRRKIAL